MRKSISWVLGLLSALMACRVLAPRALAAPAGSGEVYKPKSGNRQLTDGVKPSAEGGWEAKLSR
jgi:hypothetical protein